MRRNTVISFVICIGLFEGAVLLATPSAQADERRDKALFVLGQSSRVEAGDEFEAAVVIGGDLLVSGRVRGPAVAVGGDLQVTSEGAVEAGVFAVGGALTVNEAARVEGPRVQVAGGDFSSVIAKLSEAAEERRAPSFWAGSVVRVFQVLALFVLAVALVVLAPRQVQAVRHTLLRQPAQATLAGLGVLLGFIPLCVLLGVSLLGIPLIPVAVLLLLSAFILGLTGLTTAVGYKVPAVRSKDSLFGAMAAGMLFLLVAAAVPLLGGMVLFVAAFYGAGAVVLSRFGTRLPKREPPTEQATHAEAPAAAER